MIKEGLVMLTVREEKIPLREDEEGVIYIGETRVTLDCVVEMFEHGASPEEIAEEYDSLELADIYAVLTYYLRHREEVTRYLADQGAHSEEASKPFDAAFPNRLKEKLLRARNRRENRGV